MIRHTLFAKNLGTPGERLELPPREREHLFKVFRARVGDPVELLDGRGGCACGVVAEGKCVEIETVERREAPAQQIVLACALPRRNKADTLLKQAAELGVTKIQPLLCERSVADGEPGERQELLLQEACKQSKNPFLPELAAPLKLAAAIEQLKEAGLDLYWGAIGDGSAPALPRSTKAAFFVGPEGGFTPGEEALLAGAGVHPLNLGPYVLRLETAAICGAAVLRQLLAAAARTVPLLLGALLLFAAAGCGDPSPVAKHPFMLKGKEFRAAGKNDLAAQYFLKLLERKPNSPEAHLAYASLCDEVLEQPLKAVYHYDRYLELTSEDSPERELVKRCRDLAMSKIASPDSARLQAENAALRSQIASQKKMLYQMQQKLRQRETRPASTRR